MRGRWRCHTLENPPWSKRSPLKLCTVWHIYLNYHYYPETNKKCHALQRCSDVATRDGNYWIFPPLTSAINDEVTQLINYSIRRMVLAFGGGLKTMSITRAPRCAVQAERTSTASTTRSSPAFRGDVHTFSSP